MLDIESLEIGQDEVVGLVGNNGAGKTTMFSLILDLIQATQGEVLSKGEPVHRNGDWKAYTGAYLSESFLLDFLTPEEYFSFVGELHAWSQIDTKTFLEQYEPFFNGEVLQQGKYIRDLSQGNQKKVGIIAALIGDPKVIIWDEPFASLDPSSQLRLQKLIKDLDKKGKTVLISSHDLNHIAEVCTRVVILDKGKIVKDMLKTEDALKELRAHFEM